MQSNGHQLIHVEIGVMVCRVSFTHLFPSCVYKILPRVQCAFPMCFSLSVCNKKLKQNWSLTLCYI